MIIREEEAKQQTLRRIAEEMMLAARTAPKARGMDNLEIAIAEGEDIKKLSEKMLEIGKRFNAPGITRDANNIEHAEIVFLIGTKIKSIGLQDRCGFCGHKNCNEKDKYPEQPCAYNSHDLGLAIGSAVSIAMDNRVDNRIMYSIGKAAIEMGILGQEVKIAMGIPLSASAKNPFFDRS